MSPSPTAWSTASPPPPAPANARWPPPSAWAPTPSPSPANPSANGSSRTASPPAAPRWKGGRHLHPPCPRLREDEDPHPQRRTCDHRLSGRPSGHRIRASGHGAPAHPRPPRQGRAEEIIPHVPPPPGTDLAAYYAQIVDRFSNPEVADTERASASTAPTASQSSSSPRSAMPLPPAARSRGWRWSRPCGAATATAPPMTARRSRPTTPIGTRWSPGRRPRGHARGLAGNDRRLRRPWPGCPLRPRLRAAPDPALVRRHRADPGRIPGPGPAVRVGPRT